MVLDAQHNRADEPRVLRTVVAVDFNRPRLRSETTAPGLLLVRVLDGDRHWQLTRNGTVCSPWEVQRRGLRHPLWTARADGSLRTLTKSLEVNIERGRAFFDPPAGAR